ncbi:hypothetical protein [[Mycobacterium] wendilense]|uniref:Outer membrane channel protein CpnT-like N-terminal domain-containing protein n=1 Tax=[Mycobacterium] wendilense TaxID=3064284 RepID=A0ABN9P3E2_9MYCO|nr:hypothetical protein [Mycolicibacterium sp. MU0050]CAJ1586154.1 hypothetical protein MU0050_004117 [Mycolicibacterium sp. MU0050]
MTEPLVVDPASLSGAGASVAANSDGLVAALATLTAAYNADTGQDPAGAAFGYAYQESGSEIVAAVAAGVNALRATGYRVQVTATNYSMAEVAADIGRRASPLPTPRAPSEYPTPGGDPDVNGPGTSPPVLWYLVQAFVGNIWPNGKPSELRAAAGSWRQLAEPLSAVGRNISGPVETIGAQRIPEREAMRAAVADIGSALSTLAGHSKALADELDGFADDVEATQDAVRRLLDTLKTVVGSVVDKGILGTIFELVTGDAEDKIREVAADIKVVVSNHKRQADARKELVARLKEGIRSTSRALQVSARKELVEHLGSTAGNHIANLVDARTDLQLGLSMMGPVGVVEGLLAFDPGDPKGAFESLNAMAEAALLFNPGTALPKIVMDPAGSLETVKGLVHADDIFTSDRPFLGIGALGFDAATAVIPGGAATKAGSVARVADDMTQAGSAGRNADNPVDGFPEISASTAGLGDVRRSAESVSDRLDDLGGAPVELKSVPGRPISGPHLLEPPAPRVPEGGAAVSPVHPTPQGAPAPRIDVSPEGGESARTQVPAPVARGEAPGVQEPEVAGRPQTETSSARTIELSQAEASQGLLMGPATPDVGGSSQPKPSELASSHTRNYPNPSDSALQARVAALPDSGSGPQGQNPDAPDAASSEPRAETATPSAGDEPVPGNDTRDSSEARSDPSGLTDDKREEIISTEKGSRPDPTEYLSPEYIREHLSKFEEGAARFMPEDNLSRYGIGQRDGTSFVMTGADADHLVRTASGDPRAMEKALGLPVGFLDENAIVRIDIPDPGRYNLRMPSGNEAGANDQWIPGGYLPDGLPEAVIDCAAVPPEQYLVTPIEPGE